MMCRLANLRFQAKHLIYVQLVFVSLMLFFITELHVPAASKSLTDVLTILAAICSLSRLRGVMDKKLTIVDVAVFIYSIYALTTSVLTGVNPLVAVWAMRLSFRFYIFYYVCIVLLDRDDVSSIMRMFEILFAVNVALVLFEYAVQGKSGDYLGGMFGVEQGANTYMNLYLCIMLAYETAKYLHGELSIRRLGMYYVAALGIALLAEMKFLYIEIAVIIAVSAICKKPSVKTVSFVIIAVLAVAGGLQALKVVRPDSYAVLVQGEGVDGYLSASWTGGMEMGRTTAISFIDKYFFSSSLIYEGYGAGYGNIDLNKLLGLGFGSSEASVLAVNPFSARYAGTQYGAFEFASKYLETGYVGLVLYSAVFVAMFVDTFKSGYQTNVYASIWIAACRILMPLVLMNVWYGNLRTEASYLFFFALAAPMVVRKSRSTSACRPVVEGRRELES